MMRYYIYNLIVDHKDALYVASRTQTLLHFHPFAYLQLSYLHS